MTINLIPLTEATSLLIEARGITSETATKLGWQSCADKGDAWVAIPYFRGGKIVNNKYRTLSGEKRFSQDKGGEQCLYNLDSLTYIANLKPEDQHKTEVVICEGEMDAAIAIQCGYLAVSVPNGAPDKPIDSVDSVKFNYLDDFPKLCIATLAVDDDPAGQVLRSELAQRLGWHRCKWAQYPKGCKDLNDIFIKYGQKGIDKVLQEKTKFMSAGGLWTMSELPAKPDLPAYECGIGELSSMIKIRIGDLIVVTGVPGRGKSLWVNCLAANMANNYGWHVCIASFETDPRGGVQKYLRTFFLEKSQPWDDNEIARADEWINRKFSFIVPDLNSDQMTTLPWLIERIKATITRYGTRLMIIDPWNELDHDRPNGMTLTEYVGYAVKEIKRIGKRYMCAMVVIAHPAKMQRNRDGGYDMPTLYDISDSSHFANKCDLGIVIDRIEGEVADTYATLVKVAKVREWGVIGRVGEKVLEYQPSKGRYVDSPFFVMKSEAKRQPKEKSPKPEKKIEPSVQKNLPYKDD